MKKLLLLSILLINSVFAKEVTCDGITGALSNHLTDSFHIISAHGFCINPLKHGVESLPLPLHMGDQYRMYCDQYIYKKERENSILPPDVYDINLLTEESKDIEIYVFYESATIDNWQNVPHATITTNVGIYPVNIRGIDYPTCEVVGTIDDPRKQFNFSTQVYPADQRFFPWDYTFRLMLNESME